MSAFSKLMAVTFATSLAKPFPKWKAFEYGLIDEKGSILRKPENPPERAALGGIKDFIRRIKRLLIKVVPDNRLLGVLIAAYLLKKESDLSEEEQGVQKILEKNLTETEINAMIDHLKVIVNMNIDAANL
jgi:hypothetical protein